MTPSIFTRGGAVLLAAVLLALAVPASAHEIEVGRPFPALRLPAIDASSPSSVAGFRGQKLVLHIWASW